MSHIGMSKKNSGSRSGCEARKPPTRDYLGEAGRANPHNKLRNSHRKTTLGVKTCACKVCPEKLLRRVYADATLAVDVGLTQNSSGAKKSHFEHHSATSPFTGCPPVALRRFRLLLFSTLVAHGRHQSCTQMEIENSSDYGYSTAMDKMAFHQIPTYLSLIHALHAALRLQIIMATAKERAGCT